MKSFSAGFQSDLDSRSAAFCSCVHLALANGLELFYTDWDKELTISGDIYIPIDSYIRSAIDSNSTGSVDSISLTGPYSISDTTQLNFVRGFFKGAEIEVFQVNPHNLGNGIGKLKRGWIGDITLGQFGYDIDLVGLAQALQTTNGKNYSAFCHWLFASTQCGYPRDPSAWAASTAVAIVPSRDAKIGNIIAPPSQNGFNYKCTTAGLTGPSPPTFSVVLGGTTTETLGSGAWAATTSYPAGSQILANGLIWVSDGGTSGGTEPTWTSNPGDTIADNDIIWTAYANIAAVWTTIEPGAISGSITSIPNSKSFIDSVNLTQTTADWWNNGSVRWDTGDNAGMPKSSIRTYSSGSSQITMRFATRAPMQIGDTFTIFTGCNKLKTNCQIKFDNYDNFGGWAVLSPGLQDILRNQSA